MTNLCAAPRPRTTCEGESRESLQSEVSRGISHTSDSTVADPGYAADSISTLKIHEPCGVDDDLPVLTPYQLLPQMSDLRNRTRTIAAQQRKCAQLRLHSNFPNRSPRSGVSTVTDRSEPSCRISGGKENVPFFCYHIDFFGVGTGKLSAP